MNQIFKNTPFGNFAFFALLFVVFLLGANARESGANMRVEYNTVASYYFDKSSRLFADGELPAVDKWDFAPLQHEENAPPLLAYLTVWSYKVFSIFSGNSFEEFVYGFPVLIYGLWLLALAFIFSDLFNRWIAFAGALLFSFMPVSIELTRRGLYFEETVGNLFLFLSIYFIYKIFSEPRTARSWSAGAILAITALALSWQQFPVFYGVAVIAFLLIPDRSDQKRLFVRWSLVLVVPLFLGHAIARYLVGTDYSPFAMIRELMLGFQMYGDPDLTLAMRRGDWADLAWRGFYRYFGWLGLVLIAAGFLSILSDFKNYKKRFFGLAGLVGLAALSVFVKERFLAMSMLLPLMGLGLEAIFVPEFALSAIKNLYSAAQGSALYVSHFFRRYKFYLAGIVVVAAVAVTAGMILFSARLAGPPPLTEIKIEGLEKGFEVGRERQIEIAIKNVGGSPLRDENAFAGLHIAVENAEVKNIRASSDTGQSDVALKDFAQSGRMFFFETKYGFLDAGQEGRVKFTITPLAERVRVYYRGWIPGYCSAAQRRNAIQDLLPGWRDVERAGWRNEECIQRSPENDEARRPLCPVQVFAAHTQLQNFRCFVVSAPNAN